MPRERHGYINVDELMPQVTLEQVASFYGVSLPELRQVGDEVRTRCFLNCGRAEETGDRALAIKAHDPVKRWRCHQYGCARGGNLVSLCDLLKPGTTGDGRPRGDRFKEIAADLRCMVEGIVKSPQQVASTTLALEETLPSSATEQKKNTPLVRSDNERARSLVDLDDKFLVEPAEMNAQAAGYFRRRPFLSSEMCRKWRVGYLPRSTGEDRRGGTMRGKVVYPLLSERGEVLTWFGRDPDFEAKQQKWLDGGQKDRQPEKYHFVKGFHRGLELFGQQSNRLREPGYREFVQRIGIVVVEGPNDVIGLDAIGVPAVGLNSNAITTEQVQKLSRWSKQVGGETVTVMLDCDEEGEAGAKQVLAELAQHCRVRLAWSSTMFAGQFRGRQPESLSLDEWTMIQQTLVGAE